ncbi:hypothetical protein H9P43_003886 [Blastocladiella emersonii ATCC 22665]|nr:hypothetical protein H9P43_003886 [Blastocladiella emersonii ATCC 22665]
MAALPIPRPRYTAALTRALAPSFANAVSEHPDGGRIGVARADAQHAAYNAAVRRFVGPKAVTEVATDPAHPDCCFVEDTCVAVGSVAVLTQPGHPSRRGEVAGIQAALAAAAAPGIQHVYQMHGDALLDGGDVLFTGAHLFIGLSARTNEAGAAFLSSHVNKHYPHRPAVVLDLRPQPTLHLKCVITAPTHNLLIVSDDAPGHFTYDLIPSAVRNQYDAVWVPDQVAANVLAFPDGDGGLLGVVIQAGFPTSEAILEETFAKRFPTAAVHKLDMSEFIKADGALTCCSLLFA